MGASASISRRGFLSAVALSTVAACTSAKSSAEPVAVWGSEGLHDGKFMRPRAINVFNEEIYVVDTTGRIQVFDMGGQFTRAWKIPEQDNGTPTAIIDTREGRIVVPDTHNSRILEYSPEGELQAQWGSYGNGTDEFIYPTGICQAADGTFFVSEYGEDAERVHVFDASREFKRQWGTHGDEPGNFSRAMDITLSRDERVLVSDTTNHRIQVFEQDGQLLSTFGETGIQRGSLKFPYDIAVTPDDTVVVCEYGNNRVSHLNLSGKFLGAIGSAGRAPGQFNGPRGIAITEAGKVFVADTDNNRIQEFRMEDFS